MNRDQRISTHALRNTLVAILQAVNGDEEKYEYWREKIDRDSLEDLKKLYADYPFPQDREVIGPDTCEKCGSPMRFIKAGTSKKSGKPYDAFWGCQDRKCDFTWKPIGEQDYKSQREQDSLSGIPIVEDSDFGKHYQE